MYACRIVPVNMLLVLFSQYQELHLLGKYKENNEFRQDLPNLSHLEYLWYLLNILVIYIIFSYLLGILIMHVVIS